MLILAGIALQDHVLCADGPAGILTGYAGGDFARTVADGLVEAVGFVCLLAAAVFLARQLGTRDERGRWAARTALM